VHLRHLVVASCTDILEMLGVLSAASVGICSPGSKCPATPCGALWHCKRGRRRHGEAPATPPNSCHRESVAEQRPVDQQQQQAAPTLFFCIATPNTSMVEAGRDSTFGSWYCNFAEHATSPTRVSASNQQLAIDCGEEGRAETRGSEDGHAETKGSEEDLQLTEETKKIMLHVEEKHGFGEGQRLETAMALEEHTAVSNSLAHNPFEKEIDALDCAQTPQSRESCELRMLGRSGKFYTIEVADARISDVAAPVRSISRRYREFQCLDKQVRPRLSELPTLPPKSFFFRKNFKPGFLCKREEGLGKYVAALAANPAAVEDAAVRHFLGFNSEADIHVA